MQRRWSQGLRHIIDKPLQFFFDDKRAGDRPRTIRPSYLRRRQEALEYLWNLTPPGYDYTSMNNDRGSGDGYQPPERDALLRGFPRGLYNPFAHARSTTQGHRLVVKRNCGRIIYSGCTTHRCRTHGCIRFEEHGQHNRCEWRLGNSQFSK